jgi:hypothetical protein
MRFFSRAWEETCKVLHWPKTLLLVLVLVGTVTLRVLWGWVYLWLTGQGKAVYGEMNTETAYAAGLISTAILVFIVNLLRAPFLILRDKEKEIAELGREKENLSERLRPKLSLHHADTNPWVQVQQRQRGDTNYPAHGYLYTYRISISNLGAEVIRNLRVKIASVPPELHGAPHHLHFTNDNLKPYSEARDLPMTVDEASGLFVDVITYWRGGEQTQLLSFFHTADGVSGYVPVQTYEFSLIVSSDNGGVTVQKRCRFNPRSDAAPTFEFI